MPKNLIVENYYSAWEIMFGVWISIDPCDYYEEENDDFPLSSHEPSCLSLILKEEEWKGLSNEAKEMVDTVLNSPSEILELISTPKLEKITKRSIRKYFSEIWKSRFITDITIQEVANWVNKL